MMKLSDHGRSALYVCAIVVVLSGCGGLQLPAAPSSASNRAQAFTDRSTANYRLVFKFSGKDGANPEATLTDVNGTLYGTTNSGGTKGDGTVFSVTTSGQERVIHSFDRNGGDGALPEASLINSNGKLYGTTLAGGAAGYGTAFSLTPAGSESILWSYKGSPYDGEGPAAALIAVGRKLFGTTAFGGSGSGSTCAPASESCGTVFALSKSGNEKVLYNFQGGASDTSNPLGPLVDVNATLYGTTFGVGGGADAGAVFSITTTGKERLLYSFTDTFGDGAGPESGLRYVNGAFYGTTVFGGSAGEGTVYSVTTAGKERVLHSFEGKGGAEPYASFTYFKGVLYGTTCNGGANNVGTVFSITLDGAEQLLYSFKGGTDGAHPQGGLLAYKDRLYGTTVQGGGHGCIEHSGCGTVFAFTP